ncbi:bifunctional diguanylate cyclase/phosphodiesterase [Spiribacter vilamensis]|uniref:bifunctional diguanylate cyclase/phosphodiesterase n=1 Tax=Spiribacter vilamensis TaxID=531306 RepID=UPI00102AF675|nr:bifunctional diguanylate cyclase/phosphodiesterase [Spiribacter vilamensis]TVO60128.1 GGDEF domain-containing protein [Spiribacter vilamensis]
MTILRICWRRLRSLRWIQIALLELVLVVGFGVTFAFYLGYQQQVRSETERTETTIERVAQLLGERSAESVVFRNLPEIRREMRLLETLPRAGAVQVRDRDDKLLVSAQRRGYALEYDSAAEESTSPGELGFSGAFPALSYTTAITLNSRRVGTLELTTDAEYIQDTLDRRFWRFMLESFVLWCLLGIIGTYLFVQSRFENRLRKQIQTDPITGELSRFGLQELYGDGVRYRGAALLLIDVYNIKAINNSHGISTGDRVLQGIARVLRSTLGPGATIARLDGDDFAILLPAHRWAFVRQLGDTIVSAIQEMRIDGADDVGKIEICGGGTLLAPDDALSERLSEADLAMRHAKERDWKSIVCADAAFIANSRSSGAFVTDRDIRQGLKNGEFSYYIQPLVNAETNRFIGYEALIRWTCEDEVRSPAIFLDRLREILKDEDFYAYVIAMRRALTERVARSGVGLLSYNIGLEDLQRIDDPAQLLHDFGADNDHGLRVMIEVTERGLPQYLGDDLTDLKTTWAKLTDNRTLLALDDFGALESNLYRLRELDIEYVKIDKALITAITEDAKSRAIVGSIADLCRVLDIQVIAEGIETATQSEMVKELGIAIQQGFYLGRPQPPEIYLG